MWDSSHIYTHYTINQIGASQLVPTASKVATSVHSHTIKIDESKVATNQSSKVLNLFFKGILHSRIRGSHCNELLSEMSVDLRT